MLEWDFVVLVGALSVAAVSPGPGLAAIVATAMASGARDTVWFCAGIILGDLVWLSPSLSGLAILAEQIPIVFEVIKWGGVVYLTWLALMTWHADARLTEVAAQSRERGRITRVCAGLAVTMGNPKAMLFDIALLPNLVDTTRLSVKATATLYTAVIMILSSSFAVYAMAAEAARRTMKSALAERNFNRITTTAPGGAAVWIASR